MENFLTLFGNYFIKILFELARKVTLTLHSAFLTLNYKRTSIYVRKNSKTSVLKAPDAYDAQAYLARDEADRFLRYV